jgi:hypothetical protein
MSSQIVVEKMAAVIFTGAQLLSKYYYILKNRIWVSINISTSTETNVSKCGIFAVLSLSHYYIT